MIILDQECLDEGNARKRVREEDKVRNETKKQHVIESKTMETNNQQHR